MTESFEEMVYIQGDAFSIYERLINTECRPGRHKDMTREIGIETISIHSSSL
jgi:hypothetical protein